MSSEVAPSEEPLTYYLEEELQTRSLTSRRNWNYQNTISLFKTYVLDQKDLDVAEVGRSEIRTFLNRLEDNENLASSTTRTYATALNVVYKELQADGILQKNPVQPVLRDRDFEEPPRRRREISTDEMGTFLKQHCNHPIFLAVFVLLAKTGIRVGELVNLDIRDVYLDHPLSREYSALRSELDGRPDTIYVTHEIEEGGEYRGEIRKAGNKRRRPTHIPIDEELKRVLVNYLLVRPPTAVVERPFFVGLGGTTKRLNQRLTPATVQSQLKKRAEEEDWVGESYHPMNVTPHYFRHFFTTHARNNMDPMVVKYLRGDKGEDVMDIYTHNWENRVRKEYLSSIYSLF